MDWKLRSLQNRYIAIRGLYTELRAELNKCEREYIEKAGALDEEGNVPEFLWQIEDQDAFEKLFAQFKEENGDIIGEVDDANEMLVKAEFALVKHLIKMPDVPDSMRETLEKLKRTYKNHKKLLELALSLDWTVVRGSDDS